MITHMVDDQNRLIFTTIDGMVTDELFISTLNEYETNLRIGELRTYNEIVDARRAGKIELTLSGIRKLIGIAAVNDNSEVKTKLAIVVNPGFAYGIANQYRMLRSLFPNANKEVGIFQSDLEASEWVIKTR